MLDGVGEDGRHCMDLYTSDIRLPGPQQQQHGAHPRSQREDGVVGGGGGGSGEGQDATDCLEVLPEAHEHSLCDHGLHSHSTKGESDHYGAGSHTQDEEHVQVGGEVGGGGGVVKVLWENEIERIWRGI